MTEDSDMMARLQKALKRIGIESYSISVEKSNIHDLGAYDICIRSHVQDLKDVGKDLDDNSETERLSRAQAWESVAAKREKIKALKRHIMRLNMLLAGVEREDGEDD